MLPSDQIEVHCISDVHRRLFLQSHCDVLVNLSDNHRLRLFSASETSSMPYQPHSIDTASGVPTETGTDVGLNIAIVQRHLETQWIGKNLLYCRETDSTQDVLRETFDGVIAGSVALTGCQRAGRGRRGTEWVSPSGSVAMSIAVRVSREHPERLAFLQYVAALAVVDAVSAEPQWSGLSVRIKWPNDVYADGEKIGGVLCEGVFRDGEFHVTVGIGMNITNACPTTCLRDAVSRAGGVAQEEHMREIFVGKYLSAFEKAFDEFCSQGFTGRLRERYLSAWLHSGQMVRLGGPDGPKAVVEGIAPNGAVRVFREDLRAFQDLPPDVTSLNMRENVIKEKEVSPRLKMEARTR